MQQGMGNYVGVAGNWNFQQARKQVEIRHQGSKKESILTSEMK